VPVGLDHDLRDAEARPGTAFHDAAQHAAAVLVAHPQRGRPDADPRDPAGERREAVQRDEVQRGHRRRQARQPAAACHADARGKPDRRRRGQPVDGVAAHDDQARAEEADARDDLRGDPGRVEDDQAPQRHVLEPVLADDHDQRGADADDGMRSQARRLLPQLAFGADQCGKHERQAQLGELDQPLTTGNAQHQPPR